MKIAFLASGSKGNATLISTEKTLIQIDMGVPLKMVDAGLKKLGKTRKDIQAVLITHEHTDHIGCLPLYHDQIPVYAGEGTLPKIDEEILPGVMIEIGDIRIMPFSSSHDAVNPFNFIIYADNEKLGYVTDTGVILEDGLTLLNDCTYYLFESNYDVKMLYASNRPAYLKERIDGDHGHLSNYDSACYLSSLIGKHTKQIFLGHISPECNTHDLALLTHETVYREKGVSLEGISLTCTKRWDLVLGGSL